MEHSSTRPQLPPGFENIQSIVQINRTTGLVMDFMKFFNCIPGWISLLEDEDIPVKPEQIQQRIVNSWETIQNISYQNYLKQQYIPHIKAMHHQYPDAPTMTDIEELLEASPNIDLLEQAINEIKTLSPESPTFLADYMAHYRRIYQIIYAHPPRI